MIEDCFIVESLSGCAVSTSGKFLHWNTVTGRLMTPEDEKKLKEIIDQFQKDINLLNEPRRTF